MMLFEHLSLPLDHKTAVSTWKRLIFFFTLTNNFTLLGMFNEMRSASALTTRNARKHSSIDSINQKALINQRARERERKKEKPLKMLIFLLTCNFFFFINLILAKSYIMRRQRKNIKLAIALKPQLLVAAAFNDGKLNGK